MELTLQKFSSSTAMGIKLDDAMRVAKVEPWRLASNAAELRAGGKLVAVNRRAVRSIDEATLLWTRAATGKVVLTIEQEQGSAHGRTSPPLPNEEDMPQPRAGLECSVAGGQSHSEKLLEAAERSPDKFGKMTKPVALGDASSPENSGFV